MDFQLDSLLKGYSNTCIDVGAIGKGVGALPQEGVSGALALQSSVTFHLIFVPIEISCL